MRKALVGMATTGTIAAMVLVAPAAFGAPGGGGGGGGGNKPPANTISVVQFASNGTALSATEGQAAPVSVVVTRSNSTGTAIFNLSPFDGSAHITDDYVPLWSNPVTIDPGKTSVTVLLGITDDAVTEPTETMTLKLSTTDALTQVGKKNSATVTITDNDPCSPLSVNDMTGVEGSTLTFTVSMAAPCTLPVQVHWATGGGTATAGSDYTAASGNVAIASGATSTTFNVATLPDTIDEPDQTFNVTLSAPVNTTILDGTGVGTITDDPGDGPVSFAIADATAVWEGGSLVYTVNKTGATEQTYSVDASTWADNANNPAWADAADFTAKTETLTFLPGDTQKTFTADSLQDSVTEENETLWVGLSNATLGASITDAWGEGVIKDDEPADVSVEPDGGFVAGGTPVTYTALVSNTSGDPLDGVLVRFESYSTDGSVYGSTFKYAFTQNDLTPSYSGSLGYADFAYTNSDLAAGGAPIAEGPGEAKLIFPATGPYDDIIVACITPAVAATPRCLLATDHDDDLDGNPTTGAYVTINDPGPSYPLNDYAFVFVS